MDFLKGIYRLFTILFKESSLSFVQKGILFLGPSVITVLYRNEIWIPTFTIYSTAVLEFLYFNLRLITVLSINTCNVSIVI